MRCSQCFLFWYILSHVYKNSGKWPTNSFALPANKWWIVVWKPHATLATQNVVCGPGASACGGLKEEHNLTPTESEPAF